MNTNEHAVADRYWHDMVHAARILHDMGIAVAIVPDGTTLVIRDTKVFRDVAVFGSGRIDFQGGKGIVTNAPTVFGSISDTPFAKESPPCPEPPR